MFTRGTPACTRQRSCGSQSGISTSSPLACAARQPFSAALKGSSPAAQAASNWSAGLASALLKSRGQAYPCSASRVIGIRISCLECTHSIVQLSWQAWVPAGVWRKRQEEGRPQAGAFHLLFGPDRCVLLEQLMVIALDLLPSTQGIRSRSSACSLSQWCQFIAAWPPPGGLLVGQAPEHRTL